MTPPTHLLPALLAATLALALTAPEARATNGAARPALIPAPVSLRPLPGRFALDARVRLRVPASDAGALRVAGYLRGLLARTRGLRLAAPTSSATDGAAIRFLRHAAPLGGPESYRLRIGPHGATIEAATDAGLLYGAISLWQLLPIDTTSPVPTAATRRFLPALVIDDAPRFRWRGLLLDSVRHYQSPAVIRRFIDAMALVKLNVLHWHLTDDQGWRLAVPRAPRLTAVGAWRLPAGRAAARDLDPRTHAPRLYGGFYDAREVRALVAYAAARNVTLVPEIEMPGHALAALVAYPRLAAVATVPQAVPSDWGIYAYPFNIDEATFGFLDQVMDEVLRLFPSPYVHIGGDEVDPAQWAASPEVQERARALGIADPGGIAAYFEQRMGRYLIAHGRRPVGWDETLRPGLSRRAVIMSWHGTTGAIAAAVRGNDAVIAAWPTLYFDNRQSDGSFEPPGRGRVVRLRDLYAFEPLPEHLPAALRAHILGVQGNAWSEYLRTPGQLFEMSFPRAAALAEIGWSPRGRRDWPSFERRLVSLERHYRRLGIDYSPTLYRVRSYARYDRQKAQARITLRTQGGYGRIRYRLDGGTPDTHSPIYRRPLRVDLPARLRAADFAQGAAIGPLFDRYFSLATAQHRSSQQLTLCSERLPLNVEDDAPIVGSRARFLLDIENPCWIYPHADLDAAQRLRVAVGQIPFNFQIGADRDDIHLPAPPPGSAGELQVRLDGCRGPMLARLPLAPAVANDGVTELAAVPIGGVHGRHDLCLRFAERGLDPMWAIDWIELDRRPPTSRSLAP
ncbi:MAG: family 20 glycosylhydrolase [Gammaproteobacteria bacterium]|nr:family 20 glycosylhydrolase [Gammaproteobacteria bacterium]